LLQKKSKMRAKYPAFAHGYHHTTTPPKTIKTCVATMRAKASRL